MKPVSFRARLKLRRPDEGGRKSAIVSYKKYAFRPHVIIRDGISICGVALMDQPELLPGATGEVSVMVLQPERISSIEEGDRFLLLESGYVIGEGEIGELQTDPCELATRG